MLSLPGRAGVALAAICAVLALAAPALAPSEGKNRSLPTFRRGVSLVGWYTWPASEPGLVGRYAADPFPERGRLAPEEIARLSALGFDFVRLPVDPGPLLAANPTTRGRLLARIVGTVATLRATGLKVIWDYHPRGGDPVADYSRIFEENGPDVPAFRALLGETAALLARQGEGVALEILNEPHQPCATQAAQADRLMRDAYLAIRSRAAHLPVVVEGGCLASVDGLTASDPSSLVADANVTFSFHFYEPNLFALGGDPGHRNPFLRNLGNVPYPARGSGDPAIATFAANLARDGRVDPRARADTLASGTRAIRRYVASGADRALIERRFAQVTRWARAHGIAPSRILLGEFGVPRFDGAVGQRPQDRARWLADVRAAAEGAEFGWCFWAYFDPRDRMSLVFSRHRRVDPVTGFALDLKAN